MSFWPVRTLFFSKKKLCRWILSSSFYFSYLCLFRMESSIGANLLCLNTNRIESNLKWYDMNVSFNGRIQFILLDLAQEMCRACYTYRYKLLFIEIMCQFHCIHLFIYSYIYIIHSQFLRLLKWFFIFHIYFLFFYYISLLFTGKYNVCFILAKISG